MQTARLRYAARFAPLALAALAACESSTGPQEPSRRVAVGDTIAGVLRGHTVSTYSFVGEVGAEYAVFLEALVGAAALAVTDSTSQEPLGAVYDAAGGAGLATTVTGNFSRSGVLLLSIAGGVPDTTRFRFLVYRVNRSPELRAARFTVGDTVSGEVLDPIPDVDDFVATGQAGQDLVGWMEALGSPSSGGVSMIVKDPSTGASLGNAATFVGETPRRVFALQPLPGTRDFTFTVPFPRIPGYPQYTGPYRFRFYPINHAPESVSPTLPANTVVAGEAIDIAGDVDEFTFAAAAGDEFNAFVQSSSPRITTLSVLGAIEGRGLVAAEPADTAIFQHGTGRFKVVPPVGHGIRVGSEYVTDATGPYRLYLYRINRAPELVPAALTPGDTVSGESIELPGDIDDFTFSGTAGEQFNAFLQATNPSEPLGVVLSVITPGDALLAGTQSLTAGTPLLSVSTGRFTLPVDGTYRVWLDGSVGPYRFLLYHVNSQPESVAGTLAFGDSVTVEAIDVPGDVDEFAVAVAESSLANLVFELGPDATSGSISANLLRAGSGEQVAATGSYTPGSANQTGRFAIGPGSYVLRIENPPGSSPSRGSYRVMLYRFQAGPENVSDSIVMGDTINGEQLEPPGDLDRFYLYGTKGEHINIAIQGTATGTANGGFQAFLMQPSGWPLALVAGPTSGASLDDRQTLRVDLPVTGRYLLDITGASSPEQLSEHGSYRLAVSNVSTAPEQTSEALVPGDSVTTESLDGLGDWDQFTVTATPGEELGLLFESTGTGIYPLIAAFDPVTGDSLEGTVGQFQRFAGPFRVPSGGQVMIAIYEAPSVYFRMCYTPMCGDIFRFVGGYTFRVIRVNRAPETVAAAYTVGDTVRGEAIDPIGDFDEFTATGVPGETLTSFFRVTAPPSQPGSGLTPEVINPATGDTLLGRGLQILGQQFVEFGAFSVPPGGNFLIRVRGTGTFGDDITTAPYEFFIRR
jgi:hypothetical protein